VCLETRWLGQKPWFLFPGMTLYEHVVAGGRVLADMQTRIANGEGSTN